MIRGMILSSGEGTRLGRLTEDKPKSMLEISGRPILEYNIENLKRAGIRDIIINLYHKKEAITEHFKDGRALGVNLIYLYEDKLYGTAGGVKMAAAYFPSTFVVIYGDNFSNCDLKAAIECHKQKNTIATIVLFDRMKNLNSGISGGCVKLDEANGEILEFIEGRGNVTNYVNSGIYVMEPQILDYIPQDTFYDFGKDLFPLLLKKGIKLQAYFLSENEYLFGNDTVDCYKKTRKFYQEILKGARL